MSGSGSGAGDRAVDLVRQIDRCFETELLPSYNEDSLRQILDECRQLIQANVTDFDRFNKGESSLLAAIVARHVTAENNRRCVLAYLYQRLMRLKRMRWEMGSVMPADIRYNMSELESQWFNTYCKVFAEYMSKLGDHGGLDLTQDLKPPKSIYIPVRCTKTFGEFETSDGTVVILKENTQHFLPRTDCERLIQQGYLKHVSA